MRDFGIRVKSSQVEETLKVIGNNYKDEIEKIKNARTSYTEEDFLEVDSIKHRSYLIHINHKLKRKIQRLHSKMERFM